MKALKTLGLVTYVALAAFFAFLAFAIARPGDQYPLRRCLRIAAVSLGWPVAALIYAWQEWRKQPVDGSGGLIP